MNDEQGQRLSTKAPVFPQKLARARVQNIRNTLRELHLLDLTINQYII